MYDAHLVDFKRAPTDSDDELVVDVDRAGTFWNGILSGL